MITWSSYIHLIIIKPKIKYKNNYNKFSNLTIIKINRLNVDKAEKYSHVIISYHKVLALISSLRTFHILLTWKLFTYFEFPIHADDWVPSVIAWYLLQMAHQTLLSGLPDTHSSRQFLEKRLRQPYAARLLQIFLDWTCLLAEGVAPALQFLVVAVFQTTACTLHAWKSSNNAWQPSFRYAPLF